MGRGLLRRRRPKKRLLRLSGPLLCLALLLSGCAQGNRPVDGSSTAASAEGAEKTAISLVDWMGHAEEFSACPERVVAVSGSLGEVWLNAGGTLVGTTQDAVTERALPLPEGTAVVGTIKEPDLETILSLSPDFVILSADIGSHQKLAETLEELKIPHGLFHEEYFQDYLSLLGQFTALTGQEELYEKNGLQIRSEMEEILADAPPMAGKTVLLLRAYSSGFKAKNAESLAGTMLKDFGLENVLDKYDSLLEDISMEEILRVDPDYIFVTVMGSDSEAALQYLEERLCSDPAWGGLTAVQQGHYQVLPKELFHYKPNARWGESYDYLSQLLSAG